MAKADRIKEKRPAGSRVEKDVAKCPVCARIIFLKGGARPFAWRQATLFGVGAIVLAVLIGIFVLLYF
jgi:hypothetical protein